ncbi:MAG: hypothetical protein IKO63_08055 [Paludibacteraceae bacterium]|nr:hypothetical protein [Paludibacteraceae bacterium]
MKNNIKLFLLSGLLLLACCTTMQAQQLNSTEEQTVSQEPVQQPEQKRSVVIKDGGKYYCGDLQMNGSAYKKFLHEECPQAYQQYKQGQQCMISGWVLLGFGLVSAPTSFIGWLVSGVGVVVSDVADSEKPADPKFVAENGTFLGLGFLAGAALISSVPLLTVGYKRMSKSVDTYNELCLMPQQPQAPQTDVEMSLGMTGNGVGMTIRF